MAVVVVVGVGVDFARAAVVADDVGIDDEVLA